MCGSNGGERLLSKMKKAFTLLELLVTITIIAALVAGVIVVVPSFISWAKSNADKQTYTILNDALSRYKTEGGSVSALTASSDIGALLARMQAGVTWGNRFHQFLSKGVTYPARSISASGVAAQYKFTRYNTYDSTASSGDGSGGTVTHGVQSFTSVGSTTWTVPSGITSVRVLVVAGGGGTGGYSGGGAGGLIENASYSVTPGSVISITVGAGGAGDQGYGVAGTSGGNSAFGSITAIGGGAGSPENGLDGGSGGGGGSNDQYVAGAGIAGQGYDGMAADPYGDYSGQGGGAGGPAYYDSGGHPGPAASSDITGTVQWYAEGGDAGGGSNFYPNQPGTGGANTNGNNGRNGIVIVKW